MIEQLTGEEREFIVLSMKICVLAELITTSVDDELILEAEEKQEKATIRWKELNQKISMSKLAAKLV